MKCCKYCKEEFESNTRYIDHIENFSENEWPHSKSRTTEELVREITMDGNDFRCSSNIRERLNCLMQWDDIPEDKKQSVKTECEKAMITIDEAYSKARNIAESLTKIEKHCYKN